MSDPSDPISRLKAALEGRYAIERELGEGGMATVYLAHDVRHNRNVALKVLKAELAAVVGAERFLAEIETTAKLTHPHILPLHDSGEADGFLFFVTPYIEGDTLRDKIDREKQLSIEDALDIMKKVASALDYGHEHGVVNQDIKPGNILLSERGEPTVADFGIALAVAQAGEGRVTETGLSVGTPHYMSPEQATGDRDVDPRTDVYALGCVLYEMLTGDPPYQGSTAQAVLAKILTSDAPTPTDVRASIPPNVDAAIRRALEKLPADRFSAAHEFAHALGDSGFQHGEEVAAGAPGARGLWKAVSIAASTLAILSTVGFGWSLAQDGMQIAPELLQNVLPFASLFAPKQGQPPVYPGFRVDPVSRDEVLVGYAFLTSDLPPEALGYSGSINVLVGMDLQGTLTGIRVVDYRESLQSSRGDFLSRDGFQEQFSGKHITEPFRLRRDVDGITGATITVAAMSTGIRNAARRVAAAYLSGAGPPGSDASPQYVGTISLDELRGLTWVEMLNVGLAQQISYVSSGLARIEVSLIYLRDDTVGEILLGPGQFREARRTAGSRAEEKHVILLGIDGNEARTFRPQSLFFVQDADTVWVTEEDYFSMGAPTGGKVEGQFSQVGLLLVDPALDAARSFTVFFEPGRAFPPLRGRRPDLGLFSTEYMVQKGLLPSASQAMSQSGSVTPAVPVDPASPPSALVVKDSIAPTLEYAEEEGTVLSRVLARISWARVTWLLLLLGLATWAGLRRLRPKG